MRTCPEHPEGDQVSKAIQRIAELLVTQNKCERAKGIYEYLAKSYAQTPEGREAARRQRMVLRECKPVP